MTIPPPQPPDDRRDVFLAYVVMVVTVLWVLLCGACTAVFLPLGGGDPSFLIIVGVVSALPGVAAFVVCLRHVVKRR